jgi:protocatechuate 3,4-dioxygenase beta subunit
MTNPRLTKPLTRRGFVALTALGLVGCGTTAVRAEDLVPTPAQTEGPFYPDKLPLDQDNDLVLNKGQRDPAKGTIAHLHGRILGPNGLPVIGAVIEIWQCDANGVYLHTRGGDRAKLDAGFQGYGRFQVGDDGQYRFRTIRPVSYPGRTPHIHVKIRHGETELLTTQCYVNGDPGNERDGIFRSIKDEAIRRRVLVDFTPKDNVGELDGRFDIVLGKTPKA